MMPIQLVLRLTKQTNAWMSVRHIQASICFVKSKAKCFVYKFPINVLYGCFEIVSLHIVSIKACGT